MTRALRAVVVDDEDRARRRLVRILAAPAIQAAARGEGSEGFTGLEVLAQSACGADAIADVARVGPDIVFLDVQMPDLDGFAVLAGLPRPPRYVVFTTAFDRYAIDAFAVGALDYLLKPFGEAEVCRAVRRAVERAAEERFRAGWERVAAALARPRYLERIPVVHVRDIVIVPVSQVSHFEADAEMVAIHAGGRVYATDLTLAELEERLDPERFFRAHRRTIVNLERVLRLVHVEGGRLLAVLTDGLQVEVSRTASRRLREKLGI